MLLLFIALTCVDFIEISYSWLIIEVCIDCLGVSKIFMFVYRAYLLFLKQIECDTTVVMVLLVHYNYCKQPLNAENNHELVQLFLQVRSHVLPLSKVQCYITL